MTRSSGNGVLIPFDFGIQWRGYYLHLVFVGRYSCERCLSSIQSATSLFRASRPASTSPSATFCRWSARTTTTGGRHVAGVPCRPTPPGSSRLQSCRSGVPPVSPSNVLRKKSPVCHCRVSVSTVISCITNTCLFPLVFWHCQLGDRRGIRPINSLF